MSLHPAVLDEPRDGFHAFGRKLSAGLHAYTHYVQEHALANMWGKLRSSISEQSFKKTTETGQQAVHAFEQGRVVHRQVGPRPLGPIVRVRLRHGERDRDAVDDVLLDVFAVVVLIGVARPHVELNRLAAPLAVGMVLKRSLGESLGLQSPCSYLLWWLRPVQPEPRPAVATCRRFTGRACCSASYSPA